MAKSDCQCVGGVRGFRRFAHGKQSAHHQLHLAFVGVTVAGDRSFHFARRVAKNRYAMLGPGQENHTPYFGKPQCCAYVQSRKNAFNGHGIRRVLSNQTAYQSVNVLESSANAFLLALRRNLERSIVNHAATAAIALDDTVAGRPCGGWIDPQHANSPILLLRWVRRIHLLAVDYSVYGERGLLASALSEFARRAFVLEKSCGGTREVGRPLRGCPGDLHLKARENTRIDNGIA